MVLDSLILVAAEMLLFFHIAFSLVMRAVASSVIALILTRASFGRDDCTQVLDGADIIELFPIDLDVGFHLLTAVHRVLALLLVHSFQVNIES